MFEEKPKPPMRIPGNTHEAGEFVQIENIFWDNKPKTQVTYDPSNAERSGEVYKTPPTLDLQAKQHIWNFQLNDGVKPASYVAHLTIFSVPGYVDGIDAHWGNGEPHPNYNEHDLGGFRQHIDNFWVSIHSAATGTYPIDKELLRSVLTLFHGGTRSRQHFDPSRIYKHHQYDIPQSSLAMSVYETIRITEDLAHRNGAPVTADDRTNNYAFFREIVCDGGIWMPEERATMETLATHLDDTVAPTPGTVELTERTIRCALLPSATHLDFETIYGLLRPNAQALFMQICQEYNYYDQGKYHT